MTRKDFIKMTHTERVQRHAEMMAFMGGMTTSENLTLLADERKAKARKMRNQARAGSVRHADWRRDYLQSARAFYTLARKAV